MTIRLRPPPHYSLLDSIHSWIFPDIQPVPEITDGTHFFRIVTIGDESIPLRISQHTAGAMLEVDYQSETVTPKEVREKVRRILSLNLDMSSVNDIIQHDSSLSVIEGRIQGVHPYLSDTPFEALTKSILQQQISYRAANNLTRRLVLSANITASLDGIMVYHFPDASTILSMGAERLRSLGLGYKVAYVLSISDLIQSGSLDIEGLRGRPYSEIREALLPLKGIGEWTVQATAIAGLGNFSIFPYSDLGIRNLLGRLYNKGERMTTKEVQRKAEEWGEAGPLVLYLLMCADVLDLIPVSRHRKSENA
ncbi:MAG: DNA-3-methyladenine glycosylase family protein [Candidatus Thorarchaeota archaeon]